MEYSTVRRQHQQKDHSDSVEVNQKLPTAGDNSPPSFIRSVPLTWKAYVMLTTTVILFFILYSYHDTNVANSEQMPLLLQHCPPCGTGTQAASMLQCPKCQSCESSNSKVADAHAVCQPCPACPLPDLIVCRRTCPHPPLAQLGPSPVSPLALGSPMSDRNLPLYRSTIQKRVPELKFVQFEKEGCSPFMVFNLDNKVPVNDGDIAQRHVVQGLQLQKQCAEDPNIRVVDVGGLLGDFGFMAASCGCRVDIFEPQPFYFSLISAAVQINGYGNLASVHNRAVASKPVPVRLENAHGHDGSAKMTTADTSDTSHFVVNTTTIDDIVLATNDRIHLLKIDVEGFDPDVLLLATEKLLSERRVTYVIMEYTTHYSSPGMGPWDTFLSRVHALGNVKIFCLHRHFPEYSGPIPENQFKLFYELHSQRHLQTDLFIVFDNAELPYGGPSGPWSVDNEERVSGASSKLIAVSYDIRYYTLAVLLCFYGIMFLIFE